MPSLVLMYHRVVELPLDPWHLAVTPDRFAEHLEVLRRTADVVPLAELCSGRATADGLRVAITFDDGYADNAAIALPLLERYDCPATCFVATGQVGGRREFWWDELEALLLVPPALPDRLRLGIAGTMREWTVTSATRPQVFAELWRILQPLPPSRQAAALNAVRAWASVFPPTPRPTHRAMTESQLVAFGAHPLVTLGAHTVHHPVLQGLSHRAIRGEVCGSRDALATLTGRVPTLFAYPYGAEDDLVRDVVRRAGFTHAFTTEERLLRDDDHPMGLPRFEVRNLDGNEFAATLHGWARQELPLSSPAP